MAYNMNTDDLLRIIYNDLRPDPAQPDRPRGHVSTVHSDRFATPFTDSQGRDYEGTWQFLKKLRKESKEAQQPPFLLDGSLPIYELTHEAHAQASGKVSQAEEAPGAPAPPLPPSALSGSPVIYRATPIAAAKGGSPEMASWPGLVPGVIDSYHPPSVLVLTTREMVRPPGSGTTSIEDTQGKEQRRTLIPEFARVLRIPVEEAKDLVEHLLRNGFLIHEMVHHNQNYHLSFREPVEQPVPGGSIVQWTDTGRVTQPGTVPYSYSFERGIEAEANNAMIRYWKENLPSDVGYEAGLVLIQIVARSPAFTISAGPGYEDYYRKAWEDIWGKGELHPAHPENSKHAVALNSRIGAVELQNIARRRGWVWHSSPTTIRTDEGIDVPVSVWVETDAGLRLGLKESTFRPGSWLLIFGMGVGRARAFPIAEFMNRLGRRTT